MWHYRTDDRAGACGGDRRAVWEDMAYDLNLLELAAAWRSEGRRVALATVVATWGSSPRPPGSQLLADDSGRFMGSVSEGEVMQPHCRSSRPANRSCSNSALPTRMPGRWG
jgi:XdhC and CoxI family